jgi:ketopantoate reductase
MQPSKKAWVEPLENTFRQKLTSSLQGLRIISENHGEHLVWPAEGWSIFLPCIMSDALSVTVLEAPNESTQIFDYVVCVHKAVNQSAAVKQIAPVVTRSKTCVVIIQNGVGNEDPFRQAFPENSILSVVVSEK